jgi:predicted GIY-YIG superfamily endonuclease
MWYVYVIESETDGVRYTGMSESPNHRLAEHNSGRVVYTKGHRPWKLIYQEECADREHARTREKYYKSSAGRRNLKKIISGSQVPRPNG